MIALTRDNLFTIQLALEAMITDISRKQRAALKRRDDAALERLHALGDDVMAVRRKLFEMQARGLRV